MDILDLDDDRLPSQPTDKSNESSKIQGDSPIGASAPSAVNTPPVDVPVPAQATKKVVGDPLATLKFKPKIIEALSTVFDPEIPVNIYELGLIYDVVVDADHNVRVTMTLTAPNCPAAQILPGEVKTKAASVEGVTDASVEVVWEPAWTPERMSDAAKLQLGML